ncbi:MAG: hypothetical protein JJ850_00295 [Kordiimonadaceae bacterium]|nr:hypothetical protein [Kordiimonadaceae bacterium]MBO6567762.1 hypothetical protein [Kordiimonadaceae bacterium]MBO6963023.1 hypothetical protein [Kordiimonadaceae bacterium]
MLSFFIYYVVFGAILVAVGTFLYKRWDRGQSNAVVKSIDAPEWILKTVERDTPAAEFSQQELYDFSTRLVSQLKGALASGTDAQLARVGQLLSEPQLLTEILWKDASLRLSAVFHSYPREYTSLLEAIFVHSTNTTQQYSAYRMASCVMAPPKKLRKLTERMAADKKYQSQSR